LLTPELMDKFDRIITMGCGGETSCPAGYLPTEDWDLDDPEDKPIEEVRRIRYQIKKKSGETGGGTRMILHNFNKPLNGR